MHLTTALSYKLFLNYKRPLLLSRKHAEVIGKSCQRSETGCEFRRQAFGSCHLELLVPWECLQTEAAFWPVGTPHRSQFLGHLAALSWDPFIARETAHIQQLLLQEGKGHALGLICLGTGKSKETEKQSRLLKRLLIDCLREGTVCAV